MHTLNHEYAPAGLLEMIKTAPRRVLDVGCFCGGSGRWLKTQYAGCEVIGIEPLSAAAEQAAIIYEQVINKSLEKIDFKEEGFGRGSFDTIIAADVLEHMINPWKSLERLRQLLLPEGFLYASIPNVRNLRVLQNLAEGRWLYEGAGIQDISHLRFFTRAQIFEMFMQTGWVVDEIRINPDPQLTEVFKDKDLNAIDTLEAGSLQLKHLSTVDVLELVALQFFVRAHPAKESSI